MRSIVDLDPAHVGGFLDLAPGRSGACVEAWIALQTPAFRDGVEVVAIDPSAPYASGIRRALPNARIVVDHWHLVRLANQAVTEVRQRVAREQRGRRGHKTDPAWAHRRLLLRAGDQLSPAALNRLREVLRRDDPTNEIGAAWGIKVLLRQLLALHGDTYDTARVTAARTAFVDACRIADMPETTRLAATIAAWWPQIEGFLQLGVTNPRTEGYNRLIKQVKRVACGFRNQDNYERRIMLHITATRAARTISGRRQPRPKTKSRQGPCSISGVIRAPARFSGAERTVSDTPYASRRPWIILGARVLAAAAGLAPR
jgi:transposase